MPTDSKRSRVEKEENVRLQMAWRRMVLKQLTILVHTMHRVVFSSMGMSIPPLLPSLLDPKPVNQDPRRPPSPTQTETSTGNFIAIDDFMDNDRSANRMKCFCGGSGHADHQEGGPELRQGLPSLPTLAAADKTLSVLRVDLRTAPLDAHGERRSLAGIESLDTTADHDKAKETEAVSQCRHLSTTSAGSNQYYKMVKRKHCNEILSKVPKNVDKTSQERISTPSSSSAAAATSTSASKPKHKTSKPEKPNEDEYEEYLEFKKFQEMRKGNR